MDKLHSSMHSVYNDGNFQDLFVIFFPPKSACVV